MKNTNSELQGSENGKILKAYDYIIIGAGTAGCVVARRLLDGTDATVLLIEAGDGDINQENIINPDNWIYTLGGNDVFHYDNETSSLINGRAIASPRGKILGGSSSINGLVYSRGHRENYDGWARKGNEGWDYDSVLPLFKKIEDWEGGETDFHGAGGPIHIESDKDINPIPDALIQAGISFGMPYMQDLTGPEVEGVGFLVRNIKNGKRCSAYNGYIQPVLKNKNLTVLTGASVQRLVLENTKCIGVEILKGGERYIIHANIETILSAGTYDTPRILMLSGIGPQQELNKLDIKTVINLAGVGQNLHDHPTLHSVMFERNELGDPPIAPSMAGAGIHWKSEISKLVPDLMFLIPQFPLGSPEVSAMYPPNENTFSIMPGLMQPASRGYLKMLSSKPDGPLEIQPNYLAEPEDLAALVRAVEIAFELAEQPALKKIIKRTVTNINISDKKQVEDFVRNALASYWHPVGTCAMGKGPDAVVDNLLKVHGIENLRIADASVMPDITSGSTNAPTFMIGEFAAQAILNRQL